MLRPVPLKYYLDTIESLGFDARDALAETKINIRKIGDSDYLIGVGQYLRVFENISRFSNLVGFGLDIGSRSELAHFGLLASVTFTCKSARQSMEMVWERFGEDMGLLTRPHFLHGDAKTLAVELKTPSMAQAAYRLCVEDALCKIKKLGALVTGEKIAFQHIFLSYPTPSYVSRYREMFQCPLSFDMPQTIAIVQRSALEKSLYHK